MCGKITCATPSHTEPLIEVSRGNLVKDLRSGRLATDKALHIVEDLLGHFHTSVQNLTHGACLMRQLNAEKLRKSISISNH